jgi:hypothetical protein
MWVLVLSCTIQACFEICALDSRHCRKPPQLLQFLIYQPLLFLKKTLAITIVFSFIKICSLRYFLQECNSVTLIFSFMKHVIWNFQEHNVDTNYPMFLLYHLHINLVWNIHLVLHVPITQR